MSTPSVELKNLIKEFHDNKTNQIVRAIDNISLAIEDGEFFALLGPSGCGKTTTLRAIAGFEQPTSGEVLIRGKAVQGIPPFHRPVNTVFQDYALFPHMTIMQNVMFGLKMAKVATDEAKKRAKEALELVQLAHTSERKPNQLSGGQRQRIALARALVNRPAVLLLDEPLGALDLKLRKTMQYELKTMQREVGITFIFVTHDQEEAMTMADRIAVMSEGKVLQVGRADEIYEAPANRFVADFIGETNFITGTLDSTKGDSGTLKLADGRKLEGKLKGHDLSVGEKVSMAIRPEKIRLQEVSNTVSEGTQIAGEIAESYYIGTDTRYRVVSGSDIDLVVRVQNLNTGYKSMLPPGTRVNLSWNADNATLLV
ncbi:MAG: ABC transporter ATP-binding protein [Trueperaceae bacterium]|nr:ABC transporter ATP-binding protein [Trueperaceae bacterium]